MKVVLEGYVIDLSKVIIISEVTPSGYLENFDELDGDKNQEISSLGYEFTIRFYNEKDHCCAVLGSDAYGDTHWHCCSPFEEYIKKREAIKASLTEVRENLVKLWLGDQKHLPEINLNTIYFEGPWK